MKHVKLLGLAAVVAAALMAFVGASSASATVLCSEPGTSSGDNLSAWEGLWRWDHDPRCERGSRQAHNGRH